MVQLISLRPRKSRKRQILELASLVSGWIALVYLNGPFWRWLIFDVLGFNRSKKLPDVVHFFVYDSTKIALLLLGFTFAITIVRTFVTIEKTRALLGGKRTGIGNIAAAGLGIVTPFCSCSAVPVFIGFLSAGIPIGITLTFLIASPLINEIGVGLLFSMFGWKIAAIYLFSGLIIAIAGGLILGKLKVERWVEPFVFETQVNKESGFATPRYTLSERTKIGIEESLSILRKLWPYLLMGIAIGALIHGWAPAAFFAKYGGANNPFAVLLAVLIGIPLYSGAAGVIPIIQALHDKGLPMGTLLAFMMSVVALSLPEMIMLRRVLKPKLLAAYVGIVAVGIVFVGYLFNALLH